ncbi:MAG: hypothetical protein ACRD1S_11400 [Vicinamibacterales bacterium]
MIGRGAALRHGSGLAGVAAVSVALTIAAAVSAQQNAAAPFRYERGVSGSASHAQRLPVDVPLLSGGRPFTVVRRGPRLVAEGGLADLRFFDADGREAPYLLISPPAGEPPWLRASVLPIAVTEKTSGFEADLGTIEQVDRISVEGLGAPFLKRLTLEGSGDRRHWTMLAPEGTLFDLPAERLRQTELDFAPGPYRFFRVVWDDTNSGRVSLPAVVRARGAPAGPPPPLSTIAAAGFEHRPSEPGRSRYRVRLPGPRLPAVALRLDAAGGHISREAYVTEQRVRGGEAEPVPLGRAKLTRVIRDGAAASALRIPIASPGEAEVDLVIHDGDNPPLDITGVQIEIADLPWIYVEAKGVRIVARYGSRTAQAPSYDLEAARATIDINTVPVGSWDAPRDAIGTAAPPSADLPATGAPIETSTFRHTRAIRPGNRGLVALALDAATLAHSRGPARRFDDVRIVDASSRQIPYLVERLEEPMPLVLTIERATSRVPELAASNARRSVYRIRLPYQTLPDGTLVLTTPAQLFRRTVTVGVESPPDRRRRDYSFDVIATAVWQGVNRDAAAPELTFSVHGLDAAELLLVVDEGDNSPLPLTQARYLLPSYRLRFYRPAGTDLRLVYGRSDLTPPQYDLALLAPVVMGAEAQEIAAGNESTATAAATAAAGLVSPRMFWGFLGLAVLVLIALLVRLVRQSGHA